MTGQAHGKRFEDFVKACGRFPGSADQGRSPISDFDIEARFDRVLGLPTSVKATGNKYIALSDARRFFSIEQPFRMIVGQYEQVNDTKEFRRVYEFILCTKTLAELRGDMTIAAVTEFHEGLLLDRFPQGLHVEARTWAREKKAALSGIQTKIILNPKIDSKAQRRLQCSIRLDYLIAVSALDVDYFLHTELRGETHLPIIQRSAKRRF